MEINEIVKLLNAEVVCGHDRLNESVAFAFASDLMSDVLTLDADKLMLITGLCNMQTIRTAEMSDVSVVLVVRGKKIPDDMKEVAIENGLVLLECQYSLFRTVGILYSHGMNPVY